MEPPADENKSANSESTASPLSDQQCAQLIVDFRSVQNLVLANPVGSSDIQHQSVNVKGSKSLDSAARRPSRSAPSNPQIVIEVDSFDSKLPPLRSEPYAVSGECINLDFRAAFDITLDEGVFQRMMSPLRYRIKTNVGNCSSEDQFSRTVDEFHIDMTSFLQGEICIDSSHQTSLATVAFQLHLSKHLFNEFQIERQALGYLEFGDLSNIPSVWLQAETSTEDGADQKPGRHRIGLITSWPFNDLQIQKVIELPTDCRHLEFGICQPIFCSQSALDSLLSETGLKLDIELFCERFQAESSENIWIRHSMNSKANCHLRQLNQQIEIEFHIESLPESSSKLSVHLHLNLPERAPPRPIDHIVPPVARTPSRISVLSANEDLSNTIKKIVDMLKNKYCNQEVAQIKQCAIADGTLSLTKEMLKKPLAAITSEQFPGVSQQDLKRPVNLHQLYEIMTNESRRVFAECFSNKVKEPAIEDDANRPEGKTRKIKEALITGDEQLQIRLFRDRALQTDIRTGEGIQSRTDYVKALFRFGAIEEGADMLMQLVAHHQQDFDLRRMLACAFLERDPKSEDAAALLRLDVESNPISEVAFSLRTISQFMREDTKLAMQNLSRAKLQNINAFAISSGYALQLGLPNLAKYANDRNPEEAANVEWLVRQARIWVLLMQFERAIECFQKALSDNPRDYDLLKGLSSAYFSMNMMNEAAKCWEQLLSHRSRADCISCARLGKFYLDSGKYSSAITALTLSLQQEQLSITWKWLGDAYRLVNNQAHAVQALSQANLLDRYDAETWALLIICCLGLNRFHEARHAIKVLADLGPIDRKDLQHSIVEGVAKSGLDELVELDQCFSS